METPEYAALVAAGAEGLVVYQETYDRAVYAEMHTAGPKKDFDWRLACPERAYAGGFRRIGIGALFGLADWRDGSAGAGRASRASAAHLLEGAVHREPAAAASRARANFEPRIRCRDREFVQLICALRVCFPQVGIVLSTREPAPLRDALLPLGITMMSAGSHTEPGGYTGQGRDDLHLTVRGKALAPADSRRRRGRDGAIRNRRRTLRPREVAALLRARGFEPVWKDWDARHSRVVTHRSQRRAARSLARRNVAELDRRTRPARAGHARRAQRPRPAPRRMAGAHARRGRPHRAHPHRRRRLT